MNPLPEQLPMLFHMSVSRERVVAADEVAVALATHKNLQTKQQALNRLAMDGLLPRYRQGGLQQPVF